METEPQTSDRIDAETIIMGVLGEVMAMGANDSERSVLMSIRDDFRNKLISAKEAVEKAEGIRDSKNAYH